MIVGAFLGPYRNLTTLTASVLALHPHVQVLNHAGRRLLKDPAIDFVNGGSWERFRETALDESRGGSAGLHGGSITLSHAFEVPTIRAAYRRRFGTSMMRRRVDTLVWKDSLVLSRAIRRSGASITELLDRCDGLRFLVPIRHPIDCAVSCVLYGHGKLYTPDVSVVGVMSGVLRELAWVRAVQRAAPRRVLVFWEYEFGPAVLERIARFLALDDDERWLADASRCFEVNKSYEHPEGLVARYVAKVRELFEDDRPFATKLMRFVVR